MNRPNSFVIWTAVGIGGIVAVTFVAAMLRKPKRAKIKRIIDTVAELQKPTVRMKDPDRVEDIVCRLIKGGPNKLQVVTDFDYTVSRTHYNGKTCSSTHGVVETTSIIPKEYKEKALKLYDKYHAIEIDPHMTVEEKIPYMVEWYSKSHSILMNSGVKKTDLASMVKDSTLMLRDGCETLFELLHHHGIPLLVFSAGLGDILEEALRHFECLYPNMKFISNYMQFDSEGNIIGFRGELIHMYNKNISSMNSSDYFEKLNVRTNILLLGDSLGDLDMVHGVSQSDTVLKIGFLNYKIEERLSQYLNHFDIVLIDDQTMDVLNGILRRVLY